MPPGNTVSARNETGQFVAKYDWDSLMPEIIDRLANGSSIKAMAEEIGCNDASIVFQCHSDRWRDDYLRATAIRAEIMGFKLEDIVADVETGKLQAQQGRVMADVIARRMGQLEPRKYHDRVIQQTVTHTHKVEVSVRDRLQQANTRLTQQVEGEYEIIADNSDNVTDAGSNAAETAIIEDAEGFADDGR